MRCRCPLAWFHYRLTCTDVPGKRDSTFPCWYLRESFQNLTLIFWQKLIRMDIYFFETVILFGHVTLGLFWTASRFFFFFSNLFCDSSIRLLRPCLWIIKFGRLELMRYFETGKETTKKRCLYGWVEASPLNWTKVPQFFPLVKRQHTHACIIFIVFCHQKRLQDKKTSMLLNQIS